MNEFIFIVLAAFGGLILGLFFFAGLWWTIKKSVVSKHPALLMISSLMIRFCIVLIGFYYISLGDWKRILSCLAGFIIAKFLVTRLTKSKDERQSDNKGTADNAYKS